MKRYSCIALALLSCATLAPAYAAADDGIIRHTVQFPKGQSGTTLHGSIQGNDTLDYTLVAAPGQQMSVTLNGKSSTYFNLLAPGNHGEALFNGSIEGDHYQGILPTKGQYTVRLYQMGAAKDSSTAHPFTLTIRIQGTSASRPTSQHSASGTLPCAQHSGQPMGQCPFSVTRQANGDATLTLTLPDQRQRTLFFAHGKPLNADLSQADGDMTFTWQQQDDLFLIRCGHERYEVPAAAITGG
ncbi:hypothetical protein [Edwardsiella tarda]|uniref:hypothetical protein n=1 Tax=Edwardsiella tarda TaxID=636 RepID=UPI003D2ED65E